MTRLYTLGYIGWTVEALTHTVLALEAVLADIRYSPRSRVPHWNQSRLARLLGQQYRHVKALGNRNYKGGDIELVDLPGGLRQIEALLADYKAVVLMCACCELGTCHRRVVADACRDALGLETSELRHNSGPDRQC